MTDLVAQAHDDHREVVALVIGRRGLLTRIGQRRWLPRREPDIPWARIERITGQEVRLCDAQTAAAETEGSR